jgi:hypothetical protein
VVDREALAWAAGFFDGEGYAGTIMNGSAPRFAMVVTQYERTTLERFQEAVMGLGRIYTSAPGPNGRVRCQWSAQGFEGAQAVAAVLWPWLSAPKRRQIADALMEYRRRRRLMPRGLRSHPGRSRSGFKGVYRTAGTWWARVNVGGASRHLGSFATAEEAARAYDAAALEMWGERTYLNFPKAAGG